MSRRILYNNETGSVIRGKINDNFLELFLRLIEWANGKSYETTNITYDQYGNTTSAAVIWPDGSTGTFTATNWNGTHEVWDGYTITHTATGNTIFQDAVTRNSDGAITIKPQLVII